MDRRAARGRAYARMALVGNPSDRSGGAVLAVTIADFLAEAAVAPASRPDEPHELVAAAKEVFPGPPSGDVPITCETSIPRQVGLGGSSAIVIAVMRALAEHHGVRLTPDELARAALSAERDVMGLEAGPQDRFAQAHQGLVLMEFANGASIRHLDPASLPPLFLAYNTAGAESSAVVHAELSKADRTATGQAMAALGDLARRAGVALADGEAKTLGALMDRTFDLRARLIDLDPAHLQMIETARAHGAAANYTGSGGAIAGTVPPGADWPKLRDALKSQGCTVALPSPVV